MAEWKYNPSLDDIIETICKIPFLCKGDLVPLDYYEPTNTTADVDVNRTEFWDELDDPSDILISEINNDAGFYNSLTNFTGVLTDDYWCRYNLGGGVIDCNVVPFVDTSNTTDEIFGVCNNDTFLGISNTAKGNENNLVGYWAFENSNIAYDSSGLGNDGTITGATWITAGKFGGAYEFDGIGDKINVGTIHDDMGTNTTWTISFWIKTLKDNSQLYWFDNYISLKGIRILKTDTNKIMLLVSNGTNYEAETSTGSITGDSWYHVAIANNDDESTFYINGINDSTKTRTTITGINIEGTDMFIGISQQNTYSHNGTIDEVRIWNTSLSPDQIKAEYLYGINNHPSGEYLKRGDFPAYISAHTDNVINVLSAGNWHNITFDKQASTPKHGISHTHTDSTNDTFIIGEDGVYDLHGHLSFQDSAANPVSNVVFRFIRNGTEILGTLREKDLDKKDWDTLGSTTIIASLTTGDEIKLQFTSDQTTVLLESDNTYGTHKDTGVIKIKRIG